MSNLAVWGWRTGSGQVSGNRWRDAKALQGVEQGQNSEGHAYDTEND